jgi:hypothetical protein
MLVRFEHAPCIFVTYQSFKSPMPNAFLSRPSVIVAGKIVTVVRFTTTTLVVVIYFSTPTTLALYLQTDRENSGTVLFLAAGTDKWVGDDAHEFLRMPASLSLLCRLGISVDRQ